MPYGVVSIPHATRSFLRGNGPRAPSIELKLFGEGARLITHDGTRPVLKHVKLEADPGTLDGQSHWSGTFQVSFANPHPEAEPVSTMEVNLGGRMLVSDVLAGLAQHINTRSPYGARLESERELIVFEPTVIKTGTPRSALDELFRDRGITGLAPT